MDLSKVTRTVFLNFFLFCAILLSACNDGKALSPEQQALQLRSAINNNNTEQFRALSSVPLVIRNQEWESAKDGSGFVLGKVKQTHVSTDEAFSKEIPSLLKSLQIEGEQAITDITLSMFASELGESMDDWKALTLILFKRGEGDVEHIVLMGLHKNTNKLGAIYIN